MLARQCFATLAWTKHGSAHSLGYTHHRHQGDLNMEKAVLQVLQDLNAGLYIFETDSSYSWRGLRVGEVYG